VARRTLDTEDRHVPSDSLTHAQCGYHTQDDERTVAVGPTVRSPKHRSPGGIQPRAVAGATPISGLDVA